MAKLFGVTYAPINVEDFGLVRQEKPDAHALAAARGSRNERTNKDIPRLQMSAQFG